MFSDYLPEKGHFLYCLSCMMSGPIGTTEEFSLKEAVLVSEETLRIYRIFIFQWYRKTSANCPRLHGKTVKSFRNKYHQNCETFQNIL